MLKHNIPMIPTSCISALRTKLRELWMATILLRRTKSNGNEERRPACLQFGGITAAPKSVSVSNFALHNTSAYANPSNSPLVSTSVPPIMSSKLASSSTSVSFSISAWLPHDHSAAPTRASRTLLFLSSQ